MFRHVGLVTQDIEKQLNFYVKLLGLEILSYQKEGGVYLDELLGVLNASAKICKLGKDGKTFLELLQFDQECMASSTQSLLTTGYTHFSITVKNIDDLYNRLKIEGVSFISSPLMSNSGRHIVCFCRDFEGNFIELVEEFP